MWARETNGKNNLKCGLNCCRCMGIPYAAVFFAEKYGYWQALCTKGQGKWNLEILEISGPVLGQEVGGR